MNELWNLNKINAIVYCLNDKFNTNYSNIQDWAKHLILENNPQCNNFDEFMRTQRFISRDIREFFNHESFDNLIAVPINIQALILKKFYQTENYFINFDDFLKQECKKYCTLDGLISLYANKNTSQTQEEKQKIIFRFDNLSRKEKIKFDLERLKLLKNRNLELLLINQTNVNAEITNKNDKLKSYFQYLFLDNSEMSDNELLEYFSENYADSNKETFIKKPFLRLCAFLQLGGNLYNSDGELDSNKIGKIINEQDYEYYHNYYKTPPHDQYAFFLSFYKDLPGISLTNFDKFSMVEYHPFKIFSYSFLSSILGFFIGFIATLITAAIVSVSSTILYVPMLGIPLVFMITPIIYCLYKNAKKKAEIKRKQEQFKPKTKEDREQEIVKDKKDITQGTQKEANPENTNSILDPLLNSDNVNSNKVPFSDFSDYSDPNLET